MKIIITESQLNKLILQEQIEKWEGVDIDLTISLMEYGIVAKPSKEGNIEGEWFVLYKVGDNAYDTGYFSENEIKNLIFGFDWLNEDEVEQFLSYTGESMEEFMDNSFVQKLYSLISYYGIENIMGSSYNTMPTNQALELLDDEDEDDLGSVEETNFTLNETLNEAEYKGRKVQLGKIMQGDIKKFKVYVKNDKGNVVKVNFGFGGKSAKGKVMKIKKNNPERRKAFRARHRCDNPGPRWKPRYWACRSW